MDCRDRIISEDYIEYIIDFGRLSDVLPPNIIDNCYVNIFGDLGVLYLNSRQLQELQNLEFSYRSTPKCFGLMERTDFNQLNLINSGITSVQQPPLSLTGKGVKLAFLDTGIDYTSPVFQFPDGTTRIKAIWDQTIQTGEPPQGFLYGTEYRQDIINAALKADNPYDIVPSRDEIGHGSQVAGVAAGSRIDDGLTYTGAAPEADIIVVKLRQAKQIFREYLFIPPNVPAYSESDILFAIKYLMSFYEPFISPVVLCFALGSNQGNHEGDSLLSEYLDYFCQRRNIGVVVCGGNEGDKRKHYESIIQSENGRGTENVEIRVAENDPGFWLELWGRSPAVFTVSMRSPSGERVSPISLRTSQQIDYKFIYDKTELIINSILVERGTGEQLILFRLKAPTPGIWSISVTNETGNQGAKINMWMPIAEFSNPETVFLRSSPYTTLTEPGYAENVITVSTYDDQSNSFYIASGRGFTKNGGIKPDIAAPGVNIPTLTGRSTGSSYAAAITAGAVANFMQWAVIEDNAPLVDNTDIKNYFIRGAIRNSNQVYPNQEFGFGLLNLNGIFSILAGG